MSQAAPSRPRKRDPHRPRVERFEVIAGRYADDHEVTDAARAKIRSLNDEALEIEVKGRRPFVDEEGQRSQSLTVYFIQARVQKRRD